MTFTVVVSHVNSGKSKRSHHKRTATPSSDPAAKTAGMRLRRLMSIALIPPTIMKGWDELEAYIARVPKENLERLSSTARVEAKVTFIRKPDDDFRVIEILSVPKP